MMLIEFETESSQIHGNKPVLLQTTPEETKGSPLPKISNTRMSDQLPPSVNIHANYLRTYDNVRRE